jgi:hypothetical protein
MKETRPTLEATRKYLKICPVMQGAQNLRITRKAWKIACERAQVRPQFGFGSVSNQYCAVCLGKKMPKGIEFITQKELAEFRRVRG